VIAIGLAALTGQAPAAPGRVAAATLLAGLIATPITIVLSYYLAIVTYRFGLDPDNQTVPIITSVMDLAGVACVLFVMSVSGVLPHG
jgi:mgtE-like transporter